MFIRILGQEGEAGLPQGCQGSAWVVSTILDLSPPSQCHPRQGSSVRVTGITPEDPVEKDRNVRVRFRNGFIKGYHVGSGLRQTLPRDHRPGLESVPSLQNLCAQTLGLSLYLLPTAPSALLSMWSVT